MTSYRIEHVPFQRAAVAGWQDAVRGMHESWPAVYLIDDRRRIYVGETTNARARLEQHLGHPEKRTLTTARVVLDETFNKSACLDLESRLIGWLHADGGWAEVLNRNDGQLRSDYYQRHELYEPTFEQIFAELKDLGYFSRDIPEIEGSSLFKLSPFKSLTREQAVAVDGIVEGLAEDLGSGRRSLSIVEGGPGTGKTIVAIYLMKLLRDLATAGADPDLDRDALFGDFYLDGTRQRFEGLRIGFVVPQQSLRRTVEKVFRALPVMRGPGGVRVLGQYDPAIVEEHWDLLVIDEAHRLHQRPQHPSDRRNRNRILAWMSERNMPEPASSLDWIRAGAEHIVAFLDLAQSVRPNDAPSELLRRAVEEAQADGRRYPLDAQLRVAGGERVVAWARELLGEDPLPVPRVPGYDVEFCESATELRDAVARRRADGDGLALLTAGFAWEWRTTGDRNAWRVEVDGLSLPWNTRLVDWPHSPTAGQEVGSIHTVQGYDLGHAGVIIGGDLVFRDGRVRPNRARVFDQVVERGTRGDDEALLAYLRAAYFVLLTRGMHGLAVYVEDEELRDHLRPYFTR